MPRIKKTDRPVGMKIYLPESVASLVKMELYSELEGRVPYGAQNELFIGLAKDWLRSRGVAV